MNICVDGNEANVSSRVGSNVFAYELLSELEKSTRNKSNLSWTIALRQEPLPDMPKARPGWSYEVVEPGFLWTQFGLPIFLFKNKKKFSVFFSPGHYTPFVCPIKSVNCIMDTAYLDFPDQFKPNDLFQLKHWTRIAVKNASKVIAISQATKQDIIKHYSKSPEEIVVAYPGFKKSTVEISDKAFDKWLKKMRITGPYLLFVGTIQPRKNIPDLVEAFEIFRRMIAGRNLKKVLGKKKNTKTPKLVLAGKVGWLSQDSLDRISNSPLKEDIVLTGFISEAEKQALYKNAIATVLLGTGEGFGLPPLESMAHGTPVIVANDASLPEVVGSVGLKSEPNNPQSAAELMYQVFNMTAREKARQRKLLIEQSQKFTWKKTSKVVLETLKQLG